MKKKDESDKVPTVDATFPMQVDTGEKGPLGKFMAEMSAVPTIYELSDDDRHDLVKYARGQTITLDMIDQFRKDRK